MMEQTPEKPLIKFLQIFSRFTKLLAAITLVLLLYGYLCKIAGWYFFWESEMIGGILFFILLFLALPELIRHKKSLQKKTTFEKIILIVFAFGFLVMVLLYVWARQSDVYQKAEHYLKTNPVIREQVGTVHGFFMLPGGSMVTSTGERGTMGGGLLSFVVKGTKKYIEVDLMFIKTHDTDWTFSITNSVFEQMP